jgi:hypothetical protein
MLANKSSKLLRAALMSKLSIQQSSQVPILTQAVVKVKAEHSFDTINNVCLLSSIVGSKSQVVLVNTKKSVLHPRVLLTKQLLSNFISAELPQILHRAVDKVTAVSYASLSNKLTFTFKASDAMSSNVRKL